MSGVVGKNAQQRSGQFLLNLHKIVTFSYLEHALPSIFSRYVVLSIVGG